MVLNGEDGAVMLLPDLSYTTNLNVSLGISKALNVQMSPFIFQQHSFIHYCMQQSYHLMCEQWPMLNEAVFFSDSIPTGRWPHYKIFHACDTNWAVINSLSGWTLGWPVGRLIYICTLKTLFPADRWWGSRVGGAYLGAPTLWVCAVAGSICSVLEISMEI